MGRSWREGGKRGSKHMERKGEGRGKGFRYPTDENGYEIHPSWEYKWIDWSEEGVPDRRRGGVGYQRERSSRW